MFATKHQRRTFGDYALTTASKLGCGMSLKLISMRFTTLPCWMATGLPHTKLKCHWVKIIGT